MQQVSPAVVVVVIIVVILVLIAMWHFIYGQQPKPPPAEGDVSGAPLTPDESAEAQEPKGEPSPESAGAAAEPDEEVASKEATIEGTEGG